MYFRMIWIYLSAFLIRDHLRFQGGRYFPVNYPFNLSEMVHKEVLRGYFWMVLKLFWNLRKKKIWPHTFRVEKRVFYPIFYFEKTPISFRNGKSVKKGKNGDFGLLWLGFGRLFEYLSYLDKVGGKRAPFNWFERKFRGFWAPFLTYFWWRIKGFLCISKSPPLGFFN